MSIGISLLIHYLVNVTETSTDILKWQIVYKSFYPLSNENDDQLRFH